MTRILISTGEVSGDLQGSLLVNALFQGASKRGIDLEILALGGPLMESAGAELVADTSAMGAIGLWEAIPFILPTLKLQKSLENILSERSPDVLVLIDYMGPNIRLGNLVRNKMPHVPIIYYIAPQEWAWSFGDGGTSDLIRFTDKILAIFPEEADFYTKKGGKVTWVGHPMIDTTKILPDVQIAREKLGLASGERLLLLLPASRKQELRYLMPALAKTASLLQDRDPSLKILIPAGLKSFEQPIRDCMDAEGVVGRVIPAADSNKLKPFLFAATDLAIGKTGTVNMELALHNVPQIVGYKVSRMTAFLAKYILRFHVDFISPVNLLLNEALVPELVQDEFRTETLVQISTTLLNDSSARLKILEGYERLRAKLGSPGVTKRAAKSILESIGK